MMRFQSNLLAVSRWLVITCIGLITTISAFGQKPDEDPIRIKLVKAKADFASSLERHRQTVIALLDKQVNTAQSKGDKKGFDEATAERQSFVETGKLPKSTPAAVKKNLERARGRLVNAFETAIREYLIAKKVEESSLIEKEKKDFLLGDTRPQDAVDFKGKFYKVFKESASWHQAKRKCEEMGGRLAVVENAEINEFLVKLLEKDNLAEAFLGATDEAREGEWLWVTHAKMSFSNWGVWNMNKPLDREPNNYTGNEHYLLLVALKKDRPDWRGKWGDVPDSQPNGTGFAFLCQWD